MRGRSPEACAITGQALSCLFSGGWLRGKGKEGARCGERAALGGIAGSVADDIEETAMVAGGCIGPFGGPAGASKADEEGLAAGAVDVADDPVAAFAAAVGQVVPADGFGLGREGCGDGRGGRGGGLHDCVLPVEGSRENGPPACAGARVARLWKGSAGEGALRRRRFIWRGSAGFGVRMPG